MLCTWAPAKCVHIGAVHVCDVWCGQQLLAIDNRADSGDRYNSQSRVLGVATVCQRHLTFVQVYVHMVQLLYLIYNEGHSRLS